MITYADRIYLHVPFEDRERARARGARWDSNQKCWYLECSQNRGPFREWLEEEPPPERTAIYSIASASAHVAVARSRCWKCAARIPVVCLYCADGTIGGEPYEDFTVSNIKAIDAALEGQLARWPFFRFGYDRRERGRLLANHCERCGALQQDYYLHCEPGGAFFTLKDAPSSAIELTALAGTVRLTGDEGFEP